MAFVKSKMKTMKLYIYNDGGRQAAGFKSKSDCGIRALAIACELSYEEARKRLKDASVVGKMGSRAISRGIYKDDFSAALKELGWEWCSAPKFEGRKARFSDLPHGRVIARMASHYVAVIDGHINDTWDSREKMVYGYWAKI